MAVFAVGSLLILAIAGYSDAAYCVCNSGVSDSVLQTNIDYACGAGADCTQIQQNGPCFNPNTVKGHCDYAVNSYYQKKGQTPMSCVFSGTATVTSANPSSVSTCVYPASPSNTGTPISGTPTTGTPSAGGTSATPTAGGLPNTGTPTAGGSTFPGGSTSPPFGLGPTGNGFSTPDNSAAVKLVAHNVPFAVISISVIWGSCFVSLCMSS